MQGPVQVTVVEYVNEFFKNYSKRAYGKTLLVNANKGAETLMGMLKLVLSRGGRDELRIALHCFKDQLTSAINSPQSVRQQQTEEVFALLSSLIDAAERLRQFSPVKEQISTAVLEEVRFRLYRIIVGDGFCEDVALRRRALDIAFTAMMREAADHERSRARLNKLPSSGANLGAAAAAAVAAASGAIVVAGHHHAAGAGAGACAEAAGKGPGRLRGSFQRKAAALSGPDFSSWEGLWNSLATMAPKRMLPLLQAVMTDLYLGKVMPASPAATAAAATAAGASSSSSCGAASTPRSVNAPQKQLVPLQQPQRVQSEPLQQTHSDVVAAQAPPQQQQQQAELSALPQSRPQQQQQQQQRRDTELPQCSSKETGTSKATNHGQDAGVQTGDGAEEQQQQPQQQQQQQESAIAVAPASTAAHDAAADSMAQQQQQQPSRFGRSSARPAHPIAAGYGAGAAAAAPTLSTSSENTPTAVATFSSSAAVAAVSSFNSSSSSPRQSSTPSETRGAFATLASRLSGGGSNKDKSGNAGGGSSSPRGSKWGSMAGGFLGLQSSNGVIGSGRLIPRGWVQFGGGSVLQHKGVGPAGGASCSPDANLDGDAGVPHHQQQQDQVSAAVEPGTPSKGNSATAAAAAAAVALGSGELSGSETGMPHDRGGSTGDDGEHGFEGDEPDWSRQQRSLWLDGPC